MPRARQLLFVYFSIPSVSNGLVSEKRRLGGLGQLGKRHVSLALCWPSFARAERSLGRSAAHIGEKVRQLTDRYQERIHMWCKEETLDDGRKLTEVINKEHENVKYLPDQKIPENVVAVPDLLEAVKDADILIFVIPHQFVKETCEQLQGKIKKGAFALTLIKVSETETLPRALCTRSCALVHRASTSTRRPRSYSWSPRSSRAR